MYTHIYTSCICIMYMYTETRRTRTRQKEQAREKTNRRILNDNLPINVLFPTAHRATPEPLSPMHLCPMLQHFLIIRLLPIRRSTPPPPPPPPPPLPLHDTQQLLLLPEASFGHCLWLLKCCLECRCFHS